MGDHVKEANQYIDAVLSGAIPACREVIQACQRQKKDLSRKRTEDFPYVFNRQKAKDVCDFIELLPHVKGVWATQKTASGQPDHLIKLEPWQKFILTTVFGWVHKDTGYRRFRTTYLEVPRKNAKSTLSAGVALYCLVADEEPGAEVYSAATTKDQAKIVFKTAWQMAKKSPDLLNHYGLGIGMHNLHVLATGSSFEALSAEGSTLDGLNIHCVIVDELHAHKTRAVYDVLETATGSRTQSLIWNITTAGSNMTGICYEQRQYLISILQGVHEDESYFGIVYTIDLPRKTKPGQKKIVGDDWKLEKTWRKANPNYGVSVFADDIKRLATKAIKVASAQNNFKTKRLNFWVNAETAWLNMVDWQECANYDLKLDDFLGRDCFIGVDLASKIDLGRRRTSFSQG